MASNTRKAQAPGCNRHVADLLVASKAAYVQYNGEMVNNPEEASYRTKKKRINNACVYALLYCVKREDDLRVS